jgi:thiamine pyrophosphokinase
MRAVVVAAAGQVDHSLCPHMNKADLLVAADGGAAAMLELGFVPHAVVGDFDSLSPEVASRLAECGSEFVRVQREKDETDTELAVRYALQHGADDITFLGAVGGRIDHTLANLILLAGLAKKNIPVKAVTPTLAVYAVTERLVIRGTKGELVSVFPFQGPAEGVTETGFKYPLTDAYLDPFAVVGISNELAGPEGVIQVRKGVLLVFHYHHDQKPG